VGLDFFIVSPSIDHPFGWASYRSVAVGNPRPVVATIRMDSP
jgi:hypothetical protein